MVKKVLITGGLGYIGSHTAVSLIENGYEVVIIDNLVNSNLEVLDRINQITGVLPLFVHLDLCEQNNLRDFFDSEIGKNISALIHFAAYKNVGESTEKPLKYYHNNLLALINLLLAMEDYNLTKLVFSSSCSVYGEPSEIPVKETTALKPAVSPYGNTKRISEEIIRDTTKNGSIKSVALRYFNPIGAHPSAKLGEFPSEYADNVMPALMDTARGSRDRFMVYGGDYNTRDGSCIRDYIDIMDLAEAHVKAIEYLIDQKTENSMEVYNVGVGNGTSVLELIAAIEEVTRRKINFEIMKRRDGDVEKVYADPSLANKKLKWHAKRSLNEMVHSAWNWNEHLSQQKP
ncbi:MAG TPA: UDP-glucose 4-epimerase GalE [Flavobacteriales bacterium]|nr:UDP-glucose 4-epimerase GalE [Flavobacteriales bacterium]